MFFGRETEIGIINDALTLKRASVLLYGKRKVGKTTLLTHALSKSLDKTIYYECLKSSMKENIDGFVAVLVREKIFPVPLKFDSFIDLFVYLDSLPQTLNIILDEYPYLKYFTDKKTVDSIFQNIIDNHLSHSRLFISGSHVGMMRDLLEEKNALYGRFSSIIHLKELDYHVVANFYLQKSVYEKVRLYSVFGGSPFINGFIDENKTLKENVIHTILNPSSSVYAYAENLLVSDMSASVNAERILSAISNGKKRYGEIEEKLDIESNGLLSKQLATLLQMELVSKIAPINKLSDKKKVSYELTDNLLRFYYTYVYKNKSALQMLGAEAFYEMYIEDSITTFIAHRFEELCRKYFSLKAQKGELKGVYNIGTFYYDDVKTKTNGEFDIALQRKNEYDIYEVKYHMEPLTKKEMDREVEQIKAIKGIKVGKIGFISVNGFANTNVEYDCISGEILYEI